MALIGKSLDNVTVPNADGSPIYFDVPKSEVSAQYFGAGTGSIILQGTIDSVTWSNLAVFTSNGGSFAGLIGSTGKPVIGVRASVSNLQGGGNVTATVAGA